MTQPPLAGPELEDPVVEAVGDLEQWHAGDAGGQLQAKRHAGDGAHGGGRRAPVVGMLDRADQLGQQ